jgi:hypothetical protein
MDELLFIVCGITKTRRQINHKMNISFGVFDHKALTLIGRYNIYYLSGIFNSMVHVRNIEIPPAFVKPHDRSMWANELF